MRILVIGDHESKSLWDFYEPSKLEDIDLIISCGDLSPRYLSFLVTMAHADAVDSGEERGLHGALHPRKP